MVRTARTLLGKILGVELGLTDFGHIIGYDGKNVFQTVKRLENGDRGLSGPALLRLRDLVQSASYANYPQIIIPEWSFVISTNDEDDDGSSIMIKRLWWPRMTFVATVQAQAALADLNFHHVGMVKTDQLDLEQMLVWCFHQDILPKKSWYTPFYEKGVDILVAEANRLATDTF